MSSLPVLASARVGDPDLIPAELLDELPLLASYVDRDLVYRFVNRAYERWYGVARSQILGRTIGALAGSAAVDAVRPHLEAALGGETSCFDTVVTSAAGPRPARVTYMPRRDRDGRVLGIYTLLEDLTAKRDADAAIGAALDGLADGYLALDPDFRIIAINSAAERFYGVERDDVLGRPVGDIWPGSMDGATAALVRRAMATGRAQRQELASSARPDRIMMLDVVPLHSGGVGLVIQDLTERRAIEQELATSEARFRNVAATLPGLLFLSDPSGLNSYVNDGYCRYTGLDADQLLGTGWHRIVHPDDIERAVSMWAGMIASPGPNQAEFRLRAADGSYRWFLCHASPDLDGAGGVRQWAGTAIDIHDRKLAQEALAAKRELLHSVIDASPDPIFAKNLDGSYRIANRATARALGLAPEVLVGRRDREILADELAADLEANDARVFAGETLVAEEVVDDLGIASRTYLVTKAPMRNGAGEIVGLVGVARDISDRKDGERHRELLVNELNHRVKNTLAIVQAIAQQTLRAGVDPAVAREGFESRLRSLAAAHDLLTHNSWDDFQLGDLLSRTLEPFRSGRETRFELSGPDVRIEARIAVALALALHELATNAVKYGALSNDDGRVMIAWHLVRHDDGPRLKLTWREIDGPMVNPPTQRGFGSRLIQRGLAHELRGTVGLDFAEDGVVCRIEMPLPY